MSGKTFDFQPTVELLQVLARGSLRQNLPKAVRLWVILRSLYGDETDPIRLQLNKKFTYSDWNKLFFTQTDTDHKDYKIPLAHDPQCPCAKTIRDWLFNPDSGMNAEEWQCRFLNLYPMTGQDLDNLLSFGIIPQAEKNRKNQKRLPSGRLFAITSKNIQYDFKALVEMGWLQAQAIKEGQGKKFKIVYSLVKDFPQVAIYPENAILAPGTTVVRNALANDLADFFEDFGQKINGEQRFFLDIEYIVHRQFCQQINTLRKQLKSIWHQPQIPPVKITYVSAKNYQNYHDRGEEYIVYPVCIYYSHRAPYLFAFGQTPKDDGKIDWYDYRLDRIQSLQQLKWDEVNIEGFTQLVCQSKTPNQIENYRNDAWGFDFYKPQELLLLRFDRYFHYRYIEGTERDELFTKIPYKYAESQILNARIDSERKPEILKVFYSRSPEDIYCRVNYRTDDNNVIMRLRAWGAKVEVLLPWSLRSRMAKDIEDTWKLYQG
ncbi:TIGR03985 family CRISPR-associated protein [Argonema antarcticum]|uniref:TIGR03985 family CRISPR-associated protein n=1 Tax=Argonema antarcticum TaxID=2942763 RepID=UPI002013A8DC|nr:TIGR03985 family CRISPR-associated protein [Argonema antarcticum]MCL1475009.1 TIGR03985 family CRISPR-associated protein [Argonema antarcticum A004/B2]